DFRDVRLRISAVHAERVQLHQLARVVLVQPRLPATLGAPRGHGEVRPGGEPVVEVEEHRWMARAGADEVGKAAQRVRAGGDARVASPRAVAASEMVSGWSWRSIHASTAAARTRSRSPDRGPNARRFNTWRIRRSSARGGVPRVGSSPGAPGPGPAPDAGTPPPVSAPSVRRATASRLTSAAPGPGAAAGRGTVA